MADANVEQEAADFLERVGDEDKQDPKKLASKLYKICQEMQALGKGSTLPYKTVLRALGMVMQQHFPTEQITSNGNHPGGISDKDNEAPPTSAAQLIQGDQASNASEDEKETAQPAQGNQTLDSTSTIPDPAAA